MPRLRSKLTGVVVSVDDDTAARLAGEYEPLDDPAPAKKATAKRTAKTTSSEPSPDEGE